MSRCQQTLRAQPTVRKWISWGRFAVVALLVGVVGFTFFTRVGAVRASASTVTTNTSSPISFTEFVPCAAGGAGELVDLSGELHDLFHVTLAADGSVHLHVTDNPQGVSGVGQTTGATYHGTGVTRFDANLASGFLPLNETFVNNFRIIGQGPGNNLLIHENLHVTVNPDGTVTSFHDNFSVTCM
jgi:hypothetical protein